MFQQPPGQDNREFKQITTASTTTAAMTEKVWGEYVSVVCQILVQQSDANTKIKEISAKEFKISLQISFSQPNGIAQRTLAVIRLPRMNRLFLSASKCHTLCTLDGIYNLRDKYLTEYQVKITNILILK